VINFGQSIFGDLKMLGMKFCALFYPFRLEIDLANEKY